MWFLWLNWCKSTFYTVNAPDDFKMLAAVYLLWRQRYTRLSIAIVTSLWRIVPTWFLWTLSYRNSVIELRDLRGLKIYTEYTSVPFLSSLIIGSIAVKCLASDFIIDWTGATRRARILALVVLQRQDSMRTMHGFSTQLIGNSAIWLAESFNYIN